MSNADGLLTEFRAFLESIGNNRLHGFLGDIEWGIAARELSAHTLPCLSLLDQIAANAAPKSAALARFLASHGRDFAWGQTYTAVDFGQRFIENYGWLEVFGTRGHFENERVAAGVLILGPHIDYPDHHHEAEEVYVPLSGEALWREGDGAFEPRVPGEVIHHPSNVSHAMRTGASPLLALYLWRGGPLAQRSTIGTAPAAGG